MLKLIKQFIVLGMVILTNCIAFNVNAADWPDRPITMVIMSKQGGGMDNASRLLGDAMAEKLGQPIKYVNRPGASGETALQLFLSARDDGYTIFSGNIPTLMVMYGSSEKDYEIDDLAWLGAYLRDPALLITDAHSDIHTLDDFINRARSSEQRVGVANWASVQTLALLQLQRQLDLKLEIIPYSGFSNALLSLQGGRTEAAVGNFAAVEKGGDLLSTLAIFDDNAPDGSEIEPINAANGASVIPAASIRALGVHKTLKKRYPDRYEALNEAFVGVIRDPAFIEQFKDIGADPSQSIQWDEAETDAAGMKILDLIASIGGAFRKEN